MSSVSESHIEILVALADGIIHDTTADVVRPYLDPGFPIDRLEEYLKNYTRPSETEGFKQFVTNVINSNPTHSRRMFTVLMTVLDSRILAPTLTGSLTLIRDMTVEQREQLLQSWRDSPIVTKRRAFRMVHAAAVSTFARMATDLHLKAIGYPGVETREKLYADQVPDTFKYSMLKKPQVDGYELHIPDVDVLIIGSGSGAGVVAHTIAEAGYKALVLEKGKYFSSEEFTFNDLTGYQNLYEQQGALVSSNQQLFVLAGSTFGGGSAINWSACLKTPFKVRKEWYDDFGLEWAASESFDKCTDYVWTQMGANKNNINHSLANKVILEGGAKLGYKVKEVEQNNGAHADHSCGFCHLGCKYGIKQSSPACWFREPADKGSLFMDQVKVIKVLHNRGVAIGVLCEDILTGKQFKITGPKKYVVSGGSLCTPVVLQNSGFRNKHIGANLKLHPISIVFGNFGREARADPHEHPILTSVCTEVDDLDGKAHGAKIETVLNAPFLESVFLPWQNSDKLREDLLKYQNLATMLLITRDKSSGYVRADSNAPNSLIVDYTVNQYDRNALLQAFVTTADMLYIQGAKEIFGSQAWLPVFKSEKPKHERAITDQDFVDWRNAVLKIGLDSYGNVYGSAHQMSSCRMSGKGPRYGACDENGHLFECKNVYVADASAMPTASGANPMITTMAIARHVALGLVKDLQPAAKL
ncbi:long chain fatty acid oxidase [Scheffersomyces stipitis CBS 6054]|uniref:Long-chain-alcohol oxidase n=1 Tax=Scheffersomyces stipitis (strain ATCC 58785 / CBS 6054 / NBRC 10063 / NRRL Y-11545) TaxID=322104 RepID=A3LYX9_PICST|nr:long chain fatty acid oxidase [Scheffersomyces stipitis CBS 6054]ABN68058.1 long chain fatty acid oxidase [Scheffersomyces stipitis CBS 6054]KAG2731145.1 hypothetical protein G9P44_005561 [Scheffersomyces stipitis]